VRKAKHFQRFNLVPKLRLGTRFGAKLSFAAFLGNYLIYIIKVSKQSLGRKCVPKYNLGTRIMEAGTEARPTVIP
jgi:hypothetical protein